MDAIYSKPVKPCVVLIERWIASNEIRDDDGENVCHVVDDERVSETNTESTSNNEPLNGDNKSNSLPEILEIIDDNDDKAESEVQKLIDDSASAASLLLAINKTSKSKQKSNKKKDRSSRQTKSCLQSRISSYLNDDLFSEQRDDFAALQNDVDQGEKGSNENSSENIPTSGKVDERAEFNATASPSNIFELGHALYEEMVVDVLPQNFPTSGDDTKQERPINVDTNHHENDLGSQNCDRAILCEDFSGESPGGQANAEITSVDAVDYMQQNYARQNSEYAEFCEDELRNQSSQIECADDDDNNQPIDYSIRCQYHVPTNPSVARSNSTANHMELRSFVSPAATLRTGFAGNGQRDHRFFQFPERYHIDDNQRANGKGLYFPTAQIPDQALEVPPISQYYDTFGAEVAQEQFPVEIGDLAAASNGIADRISGTPTETVNTSSQTEIESKAADTSDEKHCRMFMESSNFNLTIFVQWIYAVVQLAFNTVNPALPSNYVSANSDGSNSHDQSLNATSHSENHSNQRSGDVSNHEVSSDSKSVQTENISDGCRKKTTKKKKGISMRRSERLLEMAATKEKKSQDANEKVAVAPKKSKIDVNQEFEVENVYDSSNQPSDDNLVDAVPRKISFTMETAQTPKRSSKYLRRKRVNVNCRR